MGKKKINFRLKDWGVSRQRYWGCPIPVAYDENGKVHLIPKESLPVKLPEEIDLNKKGNPLDNKKDWKKVKINNVCFILVFLCSDFVSENNLMFELLHIFY